MSKPAPDALRPIPTDGPLALLPEALRASHGPTAGLWDEDDTEAWTPYERTPSGVAVLRIEGPLMQRGGWFFDGYESIAEDFAQACADPKVTAILLRINSPGGVVAGCFEAVRSMRAMAAQAGKPVTSFADESAYSAAYALACVGSTILLPPSGGVGSVGVIAALESCAKLNERMGLDVRVIKSGAQKGDGHPDTPITDDATARLQARVDDLAGQFATLVGACRGLAPERVLGLDAGCLYGADAVTQGLADGVCSLAEATQRAAVTVSITKNGTTMTEEEKRLLAAARAALALLGITDPDQLTAKLCALRDGQEAGKALATENATLKTALVASERKAEAGDRARREKGAAKGGKLTPAMAANPAWRAMVDGFSASQHETYFDTLDAMPGTPASRPAKAAEDPSAAHAAEVQRRTDAGRGASRTVTLTAEDRQAAKLAHISEADFLKEKLRRLNATQSTPAPTLDHVDDHDDEGEDD